MSGFFDFIKNNNTNTSPTTVPPAIPPSPVQAPGIPQQQGIGAPQAVAKPQASYNGIGNPAGGQAFNGISAPPQKIITPEQKRVQDLLNNKPPTIDNTQAAKPLGASLNSTMDPQKRTDLDLMTHLTQRSNRVFVTAQAKAKELGSAFIDSEHMLHGLLADGEIYKLLMELKVQPQQIEAELAQTYKREPAKPTPPPMSPRLKRIIDLSLIHI